MVPTNVLQRTFNIKFARSSGTAFTIEHERKQYLVTAKHLVDGIGQSDKLEIRHGQQWKTIPVRLVGLSTGGADIGVLAAGQLLSPLFELTPSGGHIILGQDVFFAGFPYELRNEPPSAMGAFPIPLLRKGILSYVSFERPNVLIVDAINNPGFSGAPLVFAKDGKGHCVHVAGVVSRFKHDDQPIYAPDGKTAYTYRWNTGFTVVHGIEGALDLIKSNPIGFPVNASAPS